jgi:hypothetical protein
MYSQPVIDEKLKIAGMYLGWTPVLHSIDEVDRFNEHMKTLLEETDNRDIVLRRELTKKEVWWIRNERAICRADAMYFKTRYAWICDEEGNVLRYMPRVGQIVFNRIIAAFDEAQIAIELQCLKGRQLGVSTEVQLDFGHRTLFLPGVNAVSSSVNAQKSELMSNMTKTLVEGIPWWLCPQRTKWKWSGNHGMVGFKHGSTIAIQSGEQNTGIAQGWTVTCAHISEVCDYPNAKVLIEEGLFRAVHTSRKVFLVLESTGNGNVGWWADKWRESKEFYPLGRSRLCPLFLPWHVGTDIYPKSDWLKKFPIPEDWRPGPETTKHAIKCKAYVRNTPMLTNVLGSDWELPRQQMWFWEFNFESAKRTHTAKEWLRQMPADDNEALSGKNDSIFGVETIEVVTECRRQDYQAYGIIGEGIDDKFEPDPAIVDYDKPRFEVSWDTPKGVKLEWMFLPLKLIDEHDENSAMAKLLVFEKPIPGVDYSMAGDTSDGIGEDRSVIDVNRIGPEDGPDVQAAEFCSNLVSTAEAANFMAAIAAWYAPDIPTWKMPLMAVEQRRKPGDDCQNQLLRMGFRRHFKFHRLDGKKPDDDERHSTRLGWYTNEWSRPYMFGRLIDSIENGWQVVNSPFCIRELADLEKKYMVSGRSRMEHMQGKHDDRVFARGIAYVIAHTKDVRIEKEKMRYNMPKGKLPELDRSWYAGFQFKIGQGERANV